MLFRCSRFSEPSVIRNVDEEIRTFCRKLADLSRINRLVADVHAELIIVWERADRRGGSFVKAADFARDALHDAVNQRKRFIFSKRHQVPLVVYKGFLPLGVDEY